MWKWLKSKFRPVCRFCEMIAQVHRAESRPVQKAQESPAFLAGITGCAIIVWNHKQFPAHSVLLIPLLHHPGLGALEQIVNQAKAVKCALGEVFSPEQIIEEQDKITGCHMYYIFQPKLNLFERKRASTQAIYTRLHYHLPQTTFLEVHI